MSKIKDVLRTALRYVPSLPERQWLTTASLVSREYFGFAIKTALYSVGHPTFEVQSISWIRKDSLIRLGGGSIGRLFFVIPLLDQR